MTQLSPVIVSPRCTKGKGREMQPTRPKPQQCGEFRAAYDQINEAQYREPPQPSSEASFASSQHPAPTPGVPPVEGENPAWPPFQESPKGAVENVREAKGATRTLNRRAPQPYVGSAAKGEHDGLCEKRAASWGVRARARGEAGARAEAV